jgi:hypothetical protein
MRPYKLTGPLANVHGRGNGPRQLPGASGALIPALARELLDKGARVIIVTTIAGAHAAQRATSVIRMVMATKNDPVGTGLVASLARPGGNTTGLATLNEDLNLKTAKALGLRSGCDSRARRRGDRAPRSRMSLVGVDLSERTPRLRLRTPLVPAWSGQAGR